MARSTGRLIFFLRAAIPIALSKQADQPAASNCSELPADARRAWNRKLDVEVAIRAAGGAVFPAARGVDFRRVQHFSDFGHDGINFDVVLTQTMRSTMRASFKWLRSS